MVPHIVNHFTNDVVGSSRLQMHVGGRVGNGPHKTLLHHQQRYHEQVERPHAPRAAERRHGLEVHGKHGETAVGEHRDDHHHFQNPVPAADVGGTQRDRAVVAGREFLGVDARLEVVRDECEREDERVGGDEQAHVTEL